ncbi:MAG: ABC transporter permease [Candidatus Eremiobacteraeota bacterium]|nr:ABC transporter permease [Candidatus Eremiobacteraeota bacterium]
MLTLVVRRLVAAIPLLFLISLISYALMGLAPGGPSEIFSAQARQMTPAARAEFIHTLGLDKPWYVQYGYWLANLLFHGSLGISYVDRRPVVTKILEKLPVTLEMLSLALVLTVIIAIPIGVYAAVRRNTAFDYATTVLAFASYGMPVFWLSIILIDVFAAHFHWFPSSGANSVGREGDQLDRLRHLVLPVIALTTVSLAGWIRYQRGAMLNVMGELYLRTARSKGLSERTVIVRHALRNALLPTITLFGLTLPGLFSGAYFIEYIFSIPGMGYLGLNAVFQRDYPTVMALTLLTAVLVVVGNLIADLLYGLADPRIRVS